MKKKYLYLTAIFLLGLNAPVPAQSQSSAYDGLQSSLNEFMEGIGGAVESLNQLNELLRLQMLFGSDIVMDMNAEFEVTGALVGTGKTPVGIGLFLHTSGRESDLHAEFDWQNRAAEIQVKSSESTTTAGVLTDPGLGQNFHVPLKSSGTQKAGKVTMFIDSVGNWYTPLEREGEDGPVGWIRTNFKMEGPLKTLEFTIEAAIDAKLTQMLDIYAYYAAINFGGEWADGFIPEGLKDDWGKGKFAITERLEQLLKELAKLRSEQMSAFPLINFAFLFSPTLARSLSKVQEQRGSWRGQEDCIIMTVVGGKDNGYLIVFDEWGRLIHLKDTDGATADYRYDKDVTVKIPSSVGWGDFKPKKSPRPRREGAVLEVD